MDKSVKARKQGNSIVVTIPRDILVEPGTEYKVKKNFNNQIIFTPTKQKAQSLNELFADWNGKYERASDLDDWDNTDPKGEEIW